MKVVILAGGLGTRLSEETILRPKPMVEIGPRPILWHIMKIYSSFGFSDFIVCCGYKGYVIKEYFSNYLLHNSDVTFDLKKGSMTVHHQDVDPWTVTLVDTGDMTQTGGRIARVERYVDGEDFMMTYGDAVSDLDVSQLADFHASQRAYATVTAVRPPARFGALEIEGDRVHRFKEKPKGGDAWVNGGFFVLSPEIFPYIPGDDCVWENEPLERLSSDGQLAVFSHDGFWQAMDTVRDRHVLEELWKLGQGPVEVLVKTTFGESLKDFAGRRVWLSGHTGFVGSWLGAWLSELGCEIEGFALPLDDSRRSGLLNPESLVSRFGDVRDAGMVRDSIGKFEPEIVLHLAAQALVLPSYRDPLSTFETNIMGTANVLEVVRSIRSVRACLVVTSDKCYADAPRPHVEGDPLGGDDPYSASKAGAEIVVQSYRSSFFEPATCALASARAGNIYGGGDWAINRIIPDVVRAIEDSSELSIRRPDAVRPWQHVLDAVAGYLRLVSAMLTDPISASTSWNFGPLIEQEVSVLEFVDCFVDAWKRTSDRPAPRLAVDEVGPPERGYLTLDSSLAARQLGWRPVLPLDQGMAWSVQWYARQLDGSTDLHGLAHEQISRYMELAQSAPVYERSIEGTS